MKYLFLLLTGILLVSTCTYKSKKVSDRKEAPARADYSNNCKRRDSGERKDMFSGIVLKADTNKSYAALREEINKIKSSIDTTKITADSLSVLFTDILLNRIIPYWYGTKWSFDGHTSIPKQGRIACGYFVSTTLKDVGLNINRYKLAQQSPGDEAKTINLGKPVLVIKDSLKEARISELNKIMKEGIYFIGFDRYHVGYILKRHGEVFLIHSNYLNPEVGVEIEPIENSMVFSSYPTIYVAEISTNKRLLKKWLINEKIEVIDSVSSR